MSQSHTDVTKVLPGNKGFIVAETQRANERLQDLKLINRDAQNIHAMFQDLKQIVDSGQKNIDLIEEKVDSAKKNVIEASLKLVKAEEYLKKRTFCAIL